jgi:GT2 family glycosyltransferase
MSGGVGVVIATSGRPDEVAALLSRLAEQTLPPAEVIVAVAADGDAPAAMPACRSAS